jgi:hypothetical protein
LKKLRKHDTSIQTKLFTPKEKWIARTIKNLQIKWIADTTRLTAVSKITNMLGSIYQKTGYSINVI